MICGYCQKDISKLPKQGQELHVAVCYDKLQEEWGVFNDKQDPPNSLFFLYLVNL